MNQNNKKKEKKSIFDFKCHRCWKTSGKLVEWQDDDFNNESKECFARCGIKVYHEHMLCNKCIVKIKKEKNELKKQLNN